MTINIAFQQEQEQRIQNDLIAVEEQIIEEASRETDQGFLIKILRLLGIAQTA